MKRKLGFLFVGSGMEIKRIRELTLLTIILRVMLSQKEYGTPKISALM